MICHTFPAIATSLDACAPDHSGPPATPGKRLAAFQSLIHSNSLSGEPKLSFCISTPTSAQLSFLRIGSASLLHS
jgi:hypothetical protein